MKAFEDWYINNFSLILFCLVGVFLIGIGCILFWMGGQYEGV